MYQRVPKLYILEHKPVADLVFSKSSYASNAVNMKNQMKNTKLCCGNG